MPGSAGVPSEDSAHHLSAGMEVFRGLRERNAALPIIAYSGTQDGAIIEALKDDRFTTFISKWESFT